METKLKKEETPEQKIAGKQCTRLAAIGFGLILLFNLLSLNGWYEVILEPIGLHEWFKTIQPDVYYEQLEQYRKNTHEENRYIVMRYWNFVVGTGLGLVLGLFLILLKPRVIIMPKNLTNKVYLKTVMIAGFSVILLCFIWRYAAHSVPPDGVSFSGKRWHYSGYFTFFVLGGGLSFFAVFLIILFTEIGRKTLIIMLLLRNRKS